MDSPWLLLWLSLPLVLLIYTAMTILWTHAGVRVCKARLQELEGKLTAIDKKLEQLRLDLREKR